jgi:acyl carrier protein
MGMVQIILALESHLGHAFAPTDIQFDHFETVATLARQLSSIDSRDQ